MDRCTSSFLLLTLVSTLSILQISFAQLVPAIMTFGDSVVDVGNNNYLPTLFRADYPPYGRDFANHKATGRFCNGKLATDITAETLGFTKYPPAYLSPEASGKNLLIGANFASAASGYDDKAALLNHAIPLYQQVEYFKEYKSKLIKIAGSKKADSIIKGAICLLSAGSSDFVQNYYVNPLLYKVYTVDAYGSFLIDNFSTFIKQVYAVGARKIGVTSLPPTGCLPAARTLFGFHEKGCVSRLNTDAQNFNKILYLTLCFCNSQSMAAEMALVKPISKFSSPKLSNPSKFLSGRRFSTVIRMSASSSPPPPTTATSKSKKGTKKEIQESLLTPRFYTTDFEEMEQLFNTEINKNLNEAEFEALLQEFKTDYNQTHFVRNKEFKEAADKLQGPLRQIFVEFLERSCTAEFSGFLLYKELGRRLKKTNPVVAEIFSLMSRDEARHAGFLNKGLSDFNLALDLGFLTKARKYTFFKPKFIFYATYLSEKIGYWRYITIYRHLKENPEFQCYPIFKYFENWCQDENRHGDFFSALMKAQPQFLNDWQAKLWSRFFCLSVYVTMYLNDCQRTNFYEGIGLNTKEFDMHVIIETNRTTARIFPAVLDVENPEFKRKLDRMVVSYEKLLAIGETDDASFIKTLKRIPLVTSLASEILAAYLMPPVESGSVDFAEFEPNLVY